MTTHGTESAGHPDSLTSHGQIQTCSGRHEPQTHQTTILFYCYTQVTFKKMSITARFKEKQRQLDLPLLVLLIPEKTFH